MVMLDSTAVTMALPGMRAELDADFNGQQWVVVAHAVPLAAFLLTGGALADRFGRRRAFRAGALLFTAGSVAAGVVGTLLALAIARGLQGVGSALLLATASTLVAQEFPGAARGRVFGGLATAATLGLALGPAVGGGLAEVDWRLVFLSVLPVGVLLLAIGEVRLRVDRPTATTPVDWPGFVLLSACLALVVLGLLRGQALGWTSTPVLAMFAGAELLLVVFLLVERARGDKAMLELALFGNRTFLGVSLVTLLSSAISLAAVFLEVLHLQNVLGHSPLGAGLRLFPLTLTLIATTAVTRRIGTRFPPGVVVGTSTLLITIGAGLITLVGPDSTWAALLPSMIVLGAGMGIGIVVRHDYSARAVEPHTANTATRINETCHHVGVALGVAAFGALFQYRVVTGIDRQDLTATTGHQTGDIGRAVAAGADEGLLPAGVAGIVRGVSVASLGFVAIVCVVVGTVIAFVAFAYIHRRDLHPTVTP